MFDIGNAVGDDMGGNGTKYRDGPHTSCLVAPSTASSIGRPRHVFRLVRASAVRNPATAAAHALCACLSMSCSSANNWYSTQYRVVASRWLA